MQYWFTSDTHFGHANILKYCSRTLFMTKKDKELFNNLAIDKVNRWRPCKESLDNMNEGLIKKWNERVKEEDTVIFLGDFCFKSGSNRGEGENIKAKYWRERLNGNIIFIKGNHDRNNTVKTRIHNLVLRIDGHFINCVHDPIHANVNYEINLTGHVHNNWKIKRIKIGETFTDCINVGCDVWNFMPVTYEEIKARYNKWKNKYFIF